MTNKRLTRRQKRQQEVEVENILNKKFGMKRITPMTKNQEKVVRAYKDGYHIANIGSAGTGKAQPLDTKILTPTGWKLMGEITIGDTVIDMDGKRVQVSGVFPQGKTDCFQLTFSDGSTTRCSSDHIWVGWLSSHYSKKAVYGEYTLKHIIDFFDVHNKPKFAIPLADINHTSYDEVTLPVDPYLLGVLIGDGCLTQKTSFTSADVSVVDRVKEIVHRDYPELTVKHNNKYDYHITGTKGDTNKLTENLRLLGIHGHTSHYKFIPSEYMNAGYDQRVELLRGLLDTDGTVGKTGTVSYSTCSTTLASNVVDLLRSVGAKSAISRKIVTNSQWGARYDVSCNIRDKSNLFWLERKRDRCTSSTQDIRQLRRQLVEIKKIDDCDTQCIMVESPTHTYITDDYIVTHNTYLSMALAIEDVLENENYEQLIIIRSAVQSREQGFMPGSLTEKMGYYETPYQDIVNDLFGRGDAYQILKGKGMLKFMSTSFVRGLTFDNAIIIVDECQNMRYDELRTIITRVGEGSRIIFCGDTRQDDLACSKNRLDVSGLRDFISVISKIDDFAIIEFNVNDIVRSGLVREFIIKEEQLA